MEIAADVTLPELGDFRWLAVSPPGLYAGTSRSS
jgi:hypothetical protein